MEPLSTHCTAKAPESLNISVDIAIGLSVCAVLAIWFHLIFRYSSAIINKVLDLITVSFEVTGGMNLCGDFYGYTLEWLDENVEDWKHCSITADTNTDEHGKVTTVLQTPPGFQKTPHYFKFNGAWIRVQRRRLGEVGIIKDETPIESVTFRTLFCHASVVKVILDQIHAKFEDEEPNETLTKYYYARAGNRCRWEEMENAKRKRPLNSVILDETTFARLVHDVKEFRNSEDWYRDRGIPYRRGHLLFGPPGNGKSSFVKAIAGEFSYNICILSLTCKELNDDSLNSLMNSTPENSIILLEDIDAAFPSRDTAMNEDDSDKKLKKNLRSPKGEVSSGKVTLRGLLNAMDGVASTEGRIIFLTTNYVERLDPAMTRPGRVDMKVAIALPTENQIERMFVRFYPEASECNRTEFVKAILGLSQPVSMAMIQIYAS